MRVPLIRAEILHVESIDNGYLLIIELKKNLIEIEFRDLKELKTELLQHFNKFHTDKIIGYIRHCDELVSIT